MAATTTTTTTMTLTLTLKATSKLAAKVNQIWTNYYLLRLYDALKATTAMAAA
jgi:hypothetical protein